MKHIILLLVLAIMSSCANEAQTAKKEVQLTESARDARIKADVAERKAVM